MNLDAPKAIRQVCRKKRRNLKQRALSIRQPELPLSAVPGFMHLNTAFLPVEIGNRDWREEYSGIDCEPSNTAVAYCPSLPFASGDKS